MLHDDDKWLSVGIFNGIELGGGLGRKTSTSKTNGERAAVHCLNARKKENFE